MDKIIDLIPVSIYWKDIDGKYLGCNQNMLSLLGYTKSTDIVGKTDHDLIWSSSAEYIRHIDNYVAATGDMQILQEEGISGLGKKTVFLSVKSPLRDSVGHIIGIMGLSVDLSSNNISDFNSTMIEQIVHQNRIMLLRQIKHDIRSPLSGIVSLIDILRVGSSDPKVLQLSEYLYKASGAFDHFINALSNACESQVNNLELDSKNQFDLIALIQKVIDLTTPIAVSKNIKLVSYFNEDLRIIINSDQDAIFRILVEMVNNAIKYTHQGLVEIKVHTYTDDKQITWAEIFIIDTGLGMSQENLEKMNSGANIGLSHKALEDGSGFGLTMVRETVKKLGLSLEVESEINKGTTMRLKTRLKV
jgi:signal transduction histidine kinase